MTCGSEEHMQPIRIIVAETHLVSTVSHKIGEQHRLEICVVGNECIDHFLEHLHITPVGKSQSVALADAVGNKRV